MKNKTILFITNNSSMMYKFRKELVAELIQKKYNIKIITPFDDKITELKNLGAELVNAEVDRRGINIFLDIKLILRYYKLIKDINPDLVITYTIKPNIYVGAICRLMRIKYMSNITGLGSTFYGNRITAIIVKNLYKYSCFKSEKVFFENNHNKDLFINEKIILDKQAVLISGSGINLEEFQYLPYPKNNKIDFLFIGRIMKEKGIEELFECIKKIMDKHESVHFTIVGPLEDDYKKEIDDLASKDYLDYYGYQSEIKSFLNKCNCLILPSYHEGLSNVILESCAIGRPVICTNIHGCKEIIINNYNGLLCERGSASSLSNCIEEFLKFDREKCAQMGHNASQYVKNNFDRKKVVEDIIDIIDKIL